MPDDTLLSQDTPEEAQGLVSFETLFERLSSGSFLSSISLLDGGGDGDSDPESPKSPTRSLSWRSTNASSLNSLSTVETGPRLLDAALIAARSNDRLSEAHAFALISAAGRADGQSPRTRVDAVLGAQKTASPIYPAGRRTVLVRKDGGRGPGEAVSVVYQSVLNAKVWWSSEERDYGIAPRPLGPRRRNSPKAGCRSDPFKDFYKGRLYTLVRRGDDGDTVAVPEAAQILQFWEASDSDSSPDWAPGA